MRISYLPTPVANYAAGGKPRTSPGPRRRTYALYDVGSARMVAAGAPHTGGLRTISGFGGGGDRAMSVTRGGTTSYAGHSMPCPYYSTRSYDSFHPTS